MSDENEQKKKTDSPEEWDPYSFFKLSADDDKKNKKDSDNSNNHHHFPFWGIMLIALGILALVNIFVMSKPDDLIAFSEFQQMVKDGRIVSVEIGDTYFVGYGPEEAVPAQKQTLKGYLLFQPSPAKERKQYKAAGMLMQSFIDLLNEKNIQYKFVVKQNNYLVQLLINLIIPFILIFLMYFLIFRKMGGGGMGGGMGSIFNVGQSRAKAVDEGKVKTRFVDVAGVDEAKEELVEVVDFLKQPKKYTEIGGKIPKGVLLVGPPGTGKTLLARAVAGEAGVPFFRISGSDFVEMFVGVGASRVRDLFKTAREKAPCIIFIDEIDAIGKSRTNNLGGNDEREQTLNQLLVEMDGFDNEKGLIVLAATNRPDILDPALLRPGRFDRQVVVDRPDVKGREAILRIHAKTVKLDTDVDFGAVAHSTAGFSGADLANIVNEAALLAVRGGRKKVTMPDFDEAVEKNIVGLQKKTRVVREDERRTVAYHETGHALVAAFTPGSDPVHKITIIPRGIGALGYTMQLPEDDVYLKTQKKLLGEVDVMLGGRAAEQIIFGEISTGAANDIQRATDTVRSMITQYGMSDRFRNMTLGKSGQGYGSGEPELVREYSEDTQKYIDDEIARIMSERYTVVVNLLSGHKDLLGYIAVRLLEKETMDGKEFKEIIKAEIHCLELEDGAKSGETKALPEQPENAGSSDSAAVEPEKQKSAKRIRKPRIKKTADSKEKDK
jgi:cell division protease FtsH